MRKRMKKVSALILSAALLCSAFVLPEVYAATRVETERKDCSIVVSLANKVYSEEGVVGFKELETLKVDVDLYKVATIAENGKYTAVDTYKDVPVFPNIEGKENSFGEWINKKLDSKTPAGDWADVAKMLKPVAETTSVTKKGSMEAGKSSVTIENLETGLYLVNAHAEKSENYEYKFMPYLISLPNNYYDEDVLNSSDAWIYKEVAVELKPEKHDRYGDLIIKKTLDVYNATNPNATFVFQIEAEKMDPDTKETKNVYSNVVAMKFTEAGNKEILIKKIPAGAAVTVTEVYSGASYQLTTEAMQTTEIVADDQYDIKKDNVQPESVATVEFANTHSGIPHGGSGVVNNFKYENKTWKWEKLEAKAN